MRRGNGDKVRLFNGKDGEWLAVLTMQGKKDVLANLASRLLPQPATGDEIRLFFTPIKKARLDFLIEKAAELGATRLSPILTRYTDVRDINESRVRQQIIEACEQCERLDIPALDPMIKLEDMDMDAMPLYACLERTDARPLSSVLKPGSAAFLIGPEGGFSEEEKEALLRCANVVPVSLGSRILRSETAALAALCTAYLTRL